MSSRWLALLPLALALAGAPRAFAKDLSSSSGAQLYRQFCASCHGKSGAGDGPVAPFFKLLPPDLTLIAKRSGGTYPAEWVHRVVDGTTDIAAHGTREMPVWGLELPSSAADPAERRQVTQASIARLVEYLRSIQKMPAK